MARIDNLTLEVFDSGWHNIVSPATGIHLERGQGDVGTLSATIYSRDLDPTVSDRLRPGAIARVRVAGANGWRQIYRCRLIDPSVTYQPRETDDRYARIETGGVDNIAAAANLPEPDGVEYIDDLYALLQPSGLPYSVNGQTQPPNNNPVAVVSYNPNASLLDQLILTRDTQLGWLWVDGDNRVNVWDDQTIDKTSQVTLDTHTYSAIDISFDPDTIVNSVIVKWLRWDEQSDSTSPVTYGPYEDSTSIANWGRHQSTMTIEGLPSHETETHIGNYANTVLSRAGNTAADVRHVTVPIPDTPAGYDLLATLDVGVFVKVKRPDNTVTKRRIVGQTVDLSPDHVSVTLTLTSPDAVMPALQHHASNTALIPDGAIDSDQLRQDAVTARKLADGSVTGPKIAQGAITTGKIGSGAVDTSKLADGSVEARKIADRAIKAGKVADGAIGTRALGDAAVTTSKLADGSVSGSKLVVGSVGADASAVGQGPNLVPDPGFDSAGWRDKRFTANPRWGFAQAVGDWYCTPGDKPGNLELTPAPIPASAGDSFRLWYRVGRTNTAVPDGYCCIAAKWYLADGTQTQTEIGHLNGADIPAVGYQTAAGNVTAPDNATGLLTRLLVKSHSNTAEFQFFEAAVTRVVTTQDLADGAVDAAKLADAAVDTSKLADGSVSGSKILDDAVTRSKISADAIGTSELIANSVTAGIINSAAVHTQHLAADAVTTSKLKAGAVTAEIIAADSVGTNELIANSVVAGIIAADTIGTSELIANSVTTGILAAHAVTADKIAVGSVGDSESAYGNGVNLIPDPQFENADWRDKRATDSPRFTYHQDNFDWYVTSGSQGGSLELMARPLPVIAGTVFTVSQDIARTTTAPNAHASLRMQWLHKDGSTSQSARLADTTAADLPFNGDPRVRMDHVTVPADVVAVTPKWTIGGGISQGEYRLFRCAMAVTVDGTHIQDGVITTQKLAANAITANKIAANAIDGKTITGATIRTAASGTRWQIDSNPSNKIKAYRDNGTESGRITVENNGFLGIGADQRMSIAGGNEFAQIDNRGVFLSKLFMGGTGTKVFTAMDAGSVSRSDWPSGLYIDVPHNLGKKPDFVFTQIMDSDSKQYLTWAPAHTDDVTIGIYIYPINNPGTGVIGNPANFVWLALA